MSQCKKQFLSFLLCCSIMFLSIPDQRIHALSDFSFIILSRYKAEVDVGEAIYIGAVTSTGKKPSWKSSSSSIASVNTYGMVTPKKAGSAVITAKIKNAEASCVITVRKTKIAISKTAASIERGESLILSASTSNASKVTWKSSKTSIAVIDEYGKITGKKPGETVITATADGSSTACILTVKLPAVRLDRYTAALYRKDTLKLSAFVSSGVKPSWKTNKKSVATVDADGIVTAVKNGTAIITATVDGVSKTCEITVMKPEIILSRSEITMKKGGKITINAKVSSGNKPSWSSSNTSVATISANGEITAKQKGKAYIYASEDGTKERCTVTVTE